MSLPKIASLRMLPLVCVAAISSCTATVGGCPPLVTYSKQFQAQAADELDALKPQSKLGTMIVDYSKLRDACRVK